ncbi:MFS transporter [Tomitella biformata]|uniref:MFS transporter n=1 Tax=Tomitella biformata TaxID=630403 RepID=UPI000466E8D4|nr:MFS transporter [Tomitella biformata]
MTFTRRLGPALAQPAHVSARRPALLIAVLCLSGIMAALVQTIIIPLIPLLPTILSTTPSDAAWAVTATLLAGAAIMPIAGRLGDMYGKRRILVISLAALAIGSAVCAASSTLVPMTTGRALQGLAMGIIPIGISIMRDELPAERFTAAIAVMSATLGVGGAVGLPVSAIISEYADWHVVFIVVAALALATLACVLAVVPESAVRSGGRFDYVGALGLALALLALLVPITKSGQWGWASPLTIALLVASLALFLGWGWYQMRARNPLVNLRISARPQVLFTNLASIAVGFGMFGMALIPPQVMMAPTDTGYGLGLTMTQTGLLLAPGGLIMLMCSPISARLIDRLGARITLVAGSTVIGLGYAVVMAVPMSILQITAANLIVSTGIGISYASMPSLIMGAVPNAETAAANSLNSLMRAIGTSTSSAVTSAVLAGMTVTVGVLEFPTIGAFRAAAAISLVASFAAIAFTLCVPRRPSRAYQPVN